jgi:NADPH2:quinone reductase
VSVIDAAGLPEVFCTVWTNMMDRCQLQAGETVLVQGGTSGIGFAAIKIAKAFGATVFATARNETKCAAIRRFGADAAINYKNDDFLDVARDLTDGRGVDVIIDIIGGDYLPKEVKLLAHGGRLMIINLRGGKIAEIDFGQIHSKHLTVTGARLRPRSIAEKSAICRSLETHVWPKFKDQTITPETYATFSFAEAAASASPDGIKRSYWQDSSCAIIGNLLCVWKKQLFAIESETGNGGLAFCRNQPIDEYLAFL